MGENYQYREHHRLPEEKLAKPSRLGLRGTGGGGGGGGEIVEVQGGHIVRSTSRKDRHSKVCTAKGARDRRVRLSAHTAIQFYDVQDRLGYDRPSKAVDWLITKAKAAIDELAELPAWKPTVELRRTTIMNFEQNPDDEIVDNQMGNNQNSSFLPQSLDSVKSFFPIGVASAPATENNSPGMQFHHSFTQNQDLKLSLQSLQDPILQHQQPPPPSHYFDGSGWPENGGFQRMMGWGGGGNGNDNANEDTVSSGFMFRSPPPPTQTPPFLQPLFSQTTNNQLFNYISQRGPLQSSNTPPVHAWVDHPPQFSGSGIDPHQTQTLGFHHPSFMPGFTSMMNPGMSIDGHPGFHISSRIQGDEEDHDGLSDKPSSASSNSHH